MPTLTKTIPFGKPWITEEEREAVLRILGGDILTHGPENKRFEEEFAQFAGGGYCVAVSSGMAALHLSYLQMGIGAGDEVLVPAQTHTATAHAVEAVGATPVFIDCDRDTGNIDVSLLEPAITARTKAISLVHFLGVPCDLDAIVSIAETHGLKIVEDCALAVGARYRGTHVGLFGETGCFSFYPVKHITTGDGGMLITRHREVAERVMKLRAFGVDRTFSERKIPGTYDVVAFGLNYRMSDINAALGRTQLRRIDENLARRRRNFTRLKEMLVTLPNVSVLDSNDANAPNSFYCLSFILEGALGARRNDVALRLNEAGVGTSVYYPQPVPRMTYYRNKYGYEASRYSRAARISDQSIALPVGPHLTAEDVETIGETVKSVLEAVSQ